MNAVIIFIMLLIAVGLLLVEIFLIPGISVAGIGGLLFLGGAVYYAYAYVGSTAGFLTLVAAFVCWLLQSLFLSAQSLGENVTTNRYRQQTRPGGH